MRRYRRRRFRKRTTAWVPGVTFDPRTSIDLTPDEPETDVYSFLASLTANSDFALAGGENAVCTRIVGEFTPVTALWRDTNLFSTYTVLRMGIFRGTVGPGGLVVVPSLWNADDLGFEEIMWMTELWVPPVQNGFAAGVPPAHWITLGTGFGGVQEGTGSDWNTYNTSKAFIDVSAKRRIASDEHVHLTLQLKAPAFLRSQPIESFFASGWFRTLVTRPV